MTGHDDDERVAGDRLRDRAHGARGPKSLSDFAVSAGFAAWNGARELVNALIEGVYAGHIECNAGEIAGLAAQHRGNAFDRNFDTPRRTEFAGVRIETEQSPSCFDFPRLRQLHPENAKIAPCDAASADAGIEYCVAVPRHAASPRRDHSTVLNGRTWKILDWVHDADGAIQNFDEHEFE